MRILSSAIFSLLASTAMADAPRVTVDIAPVHSLVAQVMEGVGSPELLIDSGASPHGYALRPSQARALQQSDIVFWVGEDLTPWLHNVIEDIAPNAEAVALLEEPSTMVLEARDVAVFEHHHDGDEGHGDHDEDKHAHDEDHDHDEHDHEEHGHDEHEHEEEHAHEGEHGHDDHDDHGHEDKPAHDDHDDHAGHDDHGEHGKDSHAWLDPVNGKLWLQAIAGHLAEADPENAVTYQVNATRAIESLDAKIKVLDVKLAPHQGKPFIVFHDAYQYFEARFGLTASGAIRIGDATTPSAGRLAELQAELTEEGVVCAFSEPQFDDGLIKAIAGDAVKTGTLDPQGVNIELGPEFYGQLMGDLANSFAECLR